ncbi:MAG: hypothetical protein J07HX5_00736, partial [halophilic archaeon J07HX5]
MGRIRHSIKLFLANCTSRSFCAATPGFLWRPGWDNDHGTVLPGTVRDAALNVSERYSDNRLLVHLLQSHIIFIGETAAR